MRKRTLLIVVGALLAAGCVAMVFMLASTVRLGVSKGSYRIDQAVLSKKIDGHRPAEIASTFDPIGTIYCTVTTTGGDGGIVGMRWLHGDQVVSDVQGKTVDNTIITYIQGTPSKPLDGGEYRVEVYILKNVVKVAKFRVLEQ